MDAKIEFMLTFPGFAPVQLSPEHQKELDLPKHCKVSDVKKALEAKKSLKSKIKSDKEMVEKNDDLKQL